jgi:hypothetical protein
MGNCRSRYVAPTPDTSSMRLNILQVAGEARPSATSRRHDVMNPHRDSKVSTADPNLSGVQPRLSGSPCMCIALVIH